MTVKVLFQGVDVYQQIAAQDSIAFPGREIFHDYIFQVVEFFVYIAVVFFDPSDGLVFPPLAGEHRLYIREQGLFFVLEMAYHFLLVFRKEPFYNVLLPVIA